MSPLAVKEAEAARAGGITGFIPTKVSNARDYPYQLLGIGVKITMMFLVNDVSGI